MKFMNLRNRKAKSVLLALALVMLSASVSMAALSVDQTAVVTEMSTLITDLIAMAWTFILSVPGAMAGIGLFKKYFRKSVA